MTRINAGIPVKSLTNKHLIAEHREIKRIPNCIRSGRYNLNNAPSCFTLGKGHVKFFYDKLYYLLKRYDEIYTECIHRGFKVQYYGDAWEGLPDYLTNDWKPSGCDRLIVQGRILERLG